MDAAISGHQDARTGIAYVPDSPYVDSGENHRVATDNGSNAEDGISMLTLRSFPSGQRNCYTLPTKSGGKYLIRMMFFHGNYDGKKESSSSVQFDLHLGTNYWDTVWNVTYCWSEAVFVAWASWVPVCLINTDHGTPFVNTVELRLLGASLYPDVTADQSMRTYDRKNFGANTTTRYVLTFPTLYCRIYFIFFGGTP